MISSHIEYRYNFGKHMSEHTDSLDSTPTGAASEETKGKQCLSTIWHRQKCMQIYIWSNVANIDCEVWL